MKPFRKLFALLVMVFALSPIHAHSDCRGCCSQHGGVICSGGITMCADGTPLSSTCLAKGCDVCEETPSPPPTPIPSPTPATDTIKIASFNIQVFGVTKADNEFVMDILARTIAEFDIVAIQEIRDSGGTAIIDLENAVDLLGSDYEVILGPRLGRTSSKEQYAFMYRVSSVIYGESYTYNDSTLDLFHREPLIASFSTVDGTFDFVLATIHTDPDEATEEIDSLPLVIEDAKDHFQGELDVIVLGDLNADCSYFDENDMTCPLRDSSYTWLISNGMDTNLATTSCAYDRIVITEGAVSEYMSAGVYRFDQVEGLSAEEAKDVSDHYPVWAEFSIDDDSGDLIPGGPVVADFIASPESGPAPLTVKFTDTSTGEISSWSWNFGDGSTSTEQMPTHTYTNDGLYTVKLTVSDSRGTSTKTDSILVNSEAKLLYFPHVASGPVWETEICIINTDAESSLAGELKAYDNSGQEVSSTLITLPPNARREITIGDELPNPSGIGYIILESDSDNVCGYTKFYTEGKYRAAVPATQDVNSGDVYISHIASGPEWWTGISIMNTTSAPKNLTIEFDNGSTKTIAIAAKEHKVFTISSLFGGIAQPNIRSGVIKTANGIIGLELFGSSGTSGKSYLSGVLLKDDTATEIYYPHVVSSAIWWTGIVAYNPSSASSDITVTPFTSDGKSLTPQTITLAPKGKYVGTAAQLDFPEGTAWFRIDTTSPITGFELFGTNNGKQLGGYTGVGISGTDGVFAKIEKDGWTGISFVNIESSPAIVTITAHNDDGSAIATETLNLAGYEKVLGVAQDLFSQNIGAATYISYSSNGEIVGFQLNGSTDGMMLDGLPGM